MKTTKLAATLLLLAAALPASAQVGVVSDVEWGNRWVDVSGNEEMYRSQIDERQGLLLRNLFVEASSEGEDFHAFDRIRLDAAGIGIGPDASLRLSAERKGLYALRFKWDRADAFSRLPTFANPLFARGVIPGQHTSDQTRTRFELRLEALPGRAITPVLEYRRVRLDGPGTTTVSLGGDEFLLDQAVEATTNEILAGVAFDTEWVAGELLYGKRSFELDDHVSLAAGFGAGNNPGSLLGVPVSATDYDRHTSTEVDTPIFTGHFVSRLGGTVRLVGAFGRSDAESDTDEIESASGRFVSFALSRFFGGLTETARTKADALAWNARLRAEASFAGHYDVVLSWGKRHRELDGAALVSSLFTATTTFSGSDPRQILEELHADTSIERDDQTAELSVVAHDLGPVSFRGSYALVDHDLDVVAAPEEIVIPGNQDGSFSRGTDRWELGTTYRNGGFSTSIDWTSEDADDPILRTDFTKRRRIRARASWRAGEFLTFSANGDRIDLDYVGGTGDSADTTQVGGSVEFRLGAPLSLRLSGSTFRNESNLTFRRPETFQIVPSVYEEDGTDVEVGFSSKLFERVKLDGAWAWISNDGPFAWRIERGRILVDVDLVRNFSILLEAARDRYEERPTLAGDYTANRYGVYLRWRH